MDELMICVAPYPGEKQNEKFPGEMDIAQEVIDSYNAGASIAHLHVRDESGLQTVNLDRFIRDIKKIKENCPIIIEGSTGGAPEHTLSERCVSFKVQGIELGSLNLGSINLFGGVYLNPLKEILFYTEELKKRKIIPFLNCFDLSHFHNLNNLISNGLISEPYTLGFVFDIPDSLPYRDKYLDIFIDEAPRNNNWFLVRHHAIGSKSFIRAIEKGGHVRVGFEDGPFLSNGKRAKSNAEMVEDIVKIAERIGRKIANTQRAREMIGIIHNLK